MARKAVQTQVQMEPNCLWSFCDYPDNFRTSGILFFLKEENQETQSVVCWLIYLYSYVANSDFGMTFVRGTME